ncbi:MAG: TonB-dependent receptor [Bacteroidetes bacterium B1(2017)]|nr:MAG: TonB-dependent receptor [Bacteroidetes bacterium B1(2017)]
MKIKISFLFLLTLFFLTRLNAQNKLEIQLKDSLSGEAIIGATIIQNGTTNGAASDANGIAKCPVSKTGMVSFTIRYVGYKTVHLDIPIPQEIKPLLVYMNQEDGELEMVIVSSVRTNSRIEDNPTRIEVLGLEEMGEENGIKPGNIMSLLGDIAGIQMQQVSASSGNTFARVQGLNGRYTQILRDGMPMYGGLSGNFGIMQIPPADLKQIEIIKGSASTLYGGDAIGGIINLVSKDPTYNPELNITLNQSSLQETNLNAYTAHRSKNVGITLFAGSTYQQALDIDKDGLSDVAGVNSYVFHPKILFYINPKATLTLNATYTSDTRAGGDMRYLTAAKNDTLYHIKTSTSRKNADLKYIYLIGKNDQLTAKVSTSVYSQNTNTKPYIFLANQNLYYSEVSYLHRRTRADWVLGLNLNGDVFTNNSKALVEVKNYQYQTLGLFAQNTWKPIEKFTLESGLRIDKHTTFGTFILPRLSALYKLNKLLSLRLNGGTGYKAPSLVSYINYETDLASLSSGISLKAERSTGFNADVNYYQQFANGVNITLNQSAFYTQISNPVFDSLTQFGTIAVNNASKALLTKGLQTYARLHAKEFELYLGYVYTQVERKFDEVNILPVITPKHNISSTFFFEPSEDWRVGIESSWIAGQLDQNYKEVKNYYLLAAMVQYSYKKLTFVLNGENLLDFRQNKLGRIYDGTISNPSFHKLWAPIDGRVINLSLQWKIYTR